MRLRLALAIMLSLACAHTKGFSPDEKGGAASGQQGAEKKAPDAPGQPPLASTPQSVLKPDAVRQLQAALKAKGLDVAEDGDLGAETQKQLQAFQKQQNLPETGLPDRETIRKLGLDPDKIYRANPK